MIKVLLALAAIWLAMSPNYQVAAGKTHRYLIQFVSFSRDKSWEVDEVKTLNGFTYFTDPVSGSKIIMTGPVIITDRGA